MPLENNLSATTDAVATGSDAETEIAPSPFAGAVLAATYYPDAAVTGANTNTRLLQIVNRKADGSGSAVVASVQFNSGTNATKAVGATLALNTPATVTPNGTGVAIAAGDVLAFVSTHVGTGLADPGGEIICLIDRSS